ncbi:hypothetical protein QYF61_012523 [Mycteria americana]|uniref:Uncharacterized protein n=1 Tax=Mycteria americana TaxID=33587 RepID=A0AAN7NXY1_MYCAM|nr:hypothetical protein QYF61_012523 [Mycteria americana]
MDRYCLYALVLRGSPEKWKDIAAKNKLEKAPQLKQKVKQILYLSLVEGDRSVKRVLLKEQENTSARKSHTVSSCRHILQQSQGKTATASSSKKWQYRARYQIMSL